MPLHREEISFQSLQSLEHGSLVGPVDLFGDDLIQARSQCREVSAQIVAELGDTTALVFAQLRHGAVQFPQSGLGTGWQGHRSLPNGRPHALLRSYGLAMTLSIPNLMLKPGEGRARR